MFDFWKLCKRGSTFKENAKASFVTERNERGFQLFSQNLREASSLYEGDEVFWPEDLIEETAKRLHDSYTILTLIAHFGKEWQPGTQTKRARIYGIARQDKSNSHLELRRDT